jgi:hypothetical protein
VKLSASTKRGGGSELVLQSGELLRDAIELAYVLHTSNEVEYLRVITLLFHNVLSHKKVGIVIRARYNLEPFPLFK